MQNKNSINIGKDSNMNQVQCLECSKNNDKVPSKAKVV